MDRMSFGLIKPPETELKRVSKILSLTWYLALIENLETVIKPDKNLIITNNTNVANFGFSKKVFGSKMTYIVDGYDYLWQIAVEDFLAVKDYIRKLLKSYIFEKTIYQSTVCHITAEDLDLIHNIAKSYLINYN